MQKIAIIDWSGVVNRAWYTLKNQKGWVFPTELEEGRSRIAKLLYALRSTIGWDKAYFAMDRRDDNKKYFRHYILEDWCKSSLKQAMCGEHLWMWIDGVWMRPGEDGKAIKLTQKLQKELGGDLREVEATELDKSYLDLVPYYKHSRDKRQWAFETDKDTVEKMWGGMADACAPLVDAKTIRIPGYEADDIAAGFADLATRTSQLVFITGDSDWEQLLLRRDTQLYRLDKGAYVEKAKAEIENELREKVTCGDSGDCIPPTLTEDGKRITASKFGEWVPSKETLDRNKRLIQLLGKDMEQLIKEAVKRQRPIETTWEDLGLSAIEREWYDEKSALDKLMAMWAENTFVPTEI